MTQVVVPVSVGELLDKLTILHLKAENIGDAAKLANVQVERAALQAVADRIPHSDALDDLYQRLLSVNADLWQIEDDIRRREARLDFGPGFIALARAVYMTNDQRAAIKKQINILTGSELIEEKSYSDYGVSE